MSAHLEVKWEKWIISIRTFDPRQDTVWVGPFNTEQEATKYAHKHFPPQFVGEAQQRKNMCGAAVHPTKKFRLPKTITGYFRTDYRGRPWIESCGCNQYPEMASLKAKRLQAGTRVVHPAKKVFEEDRRRARGGFGFVLNKESMLEKVGCYRPAAIGQMDNFLAVVNRQVDPACRVFEVKVNTKDVLPGYGTFGALEMKVVKEVDARTAGEIYKKYHDFYKRREALEDARIKVTPKMRKHAEKYLTTPDGNLIRAMLRVALQGESSISRYTHHGEKTSSAVVALTKDEKFVDQIVKVYPCLTQRGSQAVMLAMIAVCKKFREEVITLALD
jgi:hypothetical protein